MPKVIQAAEFFVVGSPVPPERLCYVERAADRRLLHAIRAQQLCCVLGPRGMGKTSLMQRAAVALRQAGELAAAIDLAQIGARSEGGTEDRWAFSVAHKVAHELDLHVDLATWWQAHTALAGEQRLVDFFWQVVLTNTTAPVTVFFDEIEVALALPFARELFTVLHSCEQRRTEEPDFARLNFVVLGCAPRRQLAGNDHSSPFMEAEAIELGDFSPEEAYRLAIGFGGEQELAKALMDRVYSWTSGHPYLTQRVARGVARKGGKLEDVERVVREQLLAPRSTDDEPLLKHIQGVLAQRSQSAQRAAKLLRRLASGGKVPAPKDVRLLEHLYLSGVVVLDANQRLVYRNRILRELTAGRWLKGSRFGRRVAAAAAVLALAAAGAAYWYTQYLPVADVATLTSDSADAPAIDAAYLRLRALPGFADSADRLLAAALARQSQGATTFAAAVAIDTRLRSLPGQGSVADPLLAAFWLRRARVAAHAEQREAAVLFALRAADLPSAERPSATAYVRELVSTDYPHLERSLRLAVAPAAWRMLFADDAVLLLDAERRMLRMPFGAAAGGSALGTAPQPLTALQHEVLSRELAVEGEGTAGELELTLQLHHPAGSELLMTLTAPSGATAAVAVANSAADAIETLVFPATEGTPLAALADEGRAGGWRLTVVDRRVGNAGELAGWQLRFAQDVWNDTPAEPLVIPEPTRTEAVTVTVYGTLAVAQPATSGAVGAVALWNLATQQLANDFTLSAAPRDVAVNATGDRLLTATAEVVTLWNTADATPVARLTTATEFVLPPLFSPDGGYIAIAESVEGAPPLYSVLRAADASLVGSIEAVAGALRWQLGPGARYVAVTGPAHVVRVLELRRGEQLRRLTHAHDVARLLPFGDGATLLTVDVAGEVAVWPLTGVGAARRLGTTVSVASVSVAADGTRVAYDTADGVVVLDVASGVPVYHLRHAGALPITATELGADGEELVTASAAALRLWSLPPAPSAVAAIAAEAAPTVVAIDRAADLVAVGLRSGQLQLRTGAELAAATAELNYFGHRGPITAVTVDAGRGLAATGGGDGIVRLWDVASAMPTGVVMQPAAESIAVVALSADGLWVANAAGSVVRVAAVADGRVAREMQSAAAITLLAFSADASAIAVGDSAGALTLTALAPTRESWTVQLGAPVTALVFAPNGEQVAVADAGRGLRVLRFADGSAVGPVRVLPQAARWLDFSADGGALLLATEAWLHALATTSPALETVHSRLAPRRLSGAALAVGPGMQVRIAGVDARGVLGATAIDLAAPAAADSPTAAVPPARDWPAAFALRLDDNGEPGPFDP